MRLVEVVAPIKHADTVLAMGKFYGALDAWAGQPDGSGRVSVRMLVPDEARQALTDSLQNLFEGEDSARIVISPIDAVLPRPAPKPMRRTSGAPSGSPRPARSSTRRSSRAPSWTAIFCCWWSSPRWSPRSDSPRTVSRWWSGPW